MRQYLAVYRASDVQTDEIRTNDDQSDSVMGAAILLS